MAMFSNWFKAKPGAPGPDGGPADTEESETAPAAPVPSVRTVQPNSAQPVRQSGEQRSPISLTSPTLAPSGNNSHATRKISFGPSDPAPLEEPIHEAPRHAEEPPAPTGPEFVVSLEVGDFVDRIPTNLLRPGSANRQQKVEFSSSELYSDLARGRATVPASVIYQKCPELFTHSISETEDVEVHLPLHRLVEQMGAALQPRQDQTPEESVAEIETPFLQVAMEDNARLAKAPGTSVGATVRAVGLPTVRRSSGPAIPPPPMAMKNPDPSGARRTGQISPISPIKQPIETHSIAAPTAQTAGPISTSKRPPSTVRASVAGGKIRLSSPAVTARTPKQATTPAVPRPSDAPSAPKVYTPASPRVPSVSPSHQVTKKTARIQIPPISLRPASAGSPRPPTTPATPAAPPPFPRRGAEPLTSFKPTGTPGSSPIEPPTFRSTPPPPPSVKPVPASFSPARSTVPPPLAPTGAEAGLIQEAQAPAENHAGGVPKDQLIEMSLAGVLRGLPRTALIVEPSSVPDDARISLPFGLIEPQLSNGRVSVPLQTFRDALPSAFNHVLSEDCDLTEVPIPLQEVFQNLPANAIEQRPDQVIEEVRNAFPTPFSQKAEEDAKRFAPPETAAAAAPVEPLVAEVAPTPAPEATAEPEPTEKPTSESFADHAEISELIGGPLAQAELSKAPEPETPTELPKLDDNAEPAPTSDEPEKQTEPLKEGGDVLDLTPAAPVAEQPPIDDAPAPAPAANDRTAVRLTDSKLQSLFMTEDELDAKTVARLVSQLPGIDSCSLMFDDGLLLASSVPQDSQTEAFSAMAPALFQRALNFTNELSLGELQGCTLYTDKGLLTLFTQANICLSVRHSGRGFLPGVREKLVIVTRELAGMYAPVASEHTPLTAES